MQFNFSVFTAIFVISFFSFQQTQASPSAAEVYGVKYAVPAQSHTGNFDGISQFNTKSTKAIIANSGGDLLFDVESGKTLKRFASLEFGSFSPDGSYATASFSHHTDFIDISNGQVTWKLDGPKEPYTDAFFDDGSKLLIVTENGRALIYDVKTRTLEKEGQCCGSVYFNSFLLKKDLGISEDGSKFFVFSYDEKGLNVKVYRTSDFVEIASLPVKHGGYNSSVVSVNFIGNSLLRIDSDAYYDSQYWDISKQSPELVCKDTNETFLPDRSNLFVCSSGDKIELRDARNFSVDLVIDRPKYPNSIRGFSPDQSYFMLYEDNRPSQPGEFLNVINSKTGKNIFRLPVPKSTMGSGSTFSISPDNSMLIINFATTGESKIYSLSTGLELQNLSGLVKDFTNFRFSPNGQFLIADDSAGKICLILEKKTQQ